ncbi:MAG: HD domain-containing protein [Polyangiales bacterium]
MTEASLLALAEARCEGRPPAHDFDHVRRVVSLGRTIAREEGANVEVVVAAAALHELVNLPKHHPDSHRSGDLCAEEAARVLAEHPAREAIVACIRAHAFSKGAAPPTLEAAVMQDADRLDAIGAVGIARCFATSTEMGRPFFHPTDPFARDRGIDDKSWGLDHFFRKLLRIEEGLHTKTARRLAGPRVAAMKAYLGALEEELLVSRDRADRGLGRP